MKAKVEWRHFRAWAYERHGYRFPHELSTGASWRAIWGSETFRIGRTGTGSGVPALYGQTQRRRFSVWIRARVLIRQIHLAKWLEAAEGHEDGWLINDGSGIRWVRDPRDELPGLLRGFVGVRCGE